MWLLPIPTNPQSGLSSILRLFGNASAIARLLCGIPSSTASPVAAQTYLRASSESAQAQVLGEQQITRACSDASVSSKNPKFQVLTVTIRVNTPVMQVSFWAQQGRIGKGAAACNPATAVLPRETAAD